MGLSIVLLAAGEGKRMKTDKPKPLVSLANHPLIQYSLDTAKELKPERLILVTGYKKDEVKKYVISKKADIDLFSHISELKRWNISDTFNLFSSFSAIL